MSILKGIFEPFVSNVLSPKEDEKNAEDSEDNVNNNSLFSDEEKCDCDENCEFSCQCKCHYCDKCYYSKCDPKMTICNCECHCGNEPNNKNDNENNIKDESTNEQSRKGVKKLSYLEKLKNNKKSQSPGKRKNNVIGMLLNEGDQENDEQSIRHDEIKIDSNQMKNEIKQPLIKFKKKNNLITNNKISEKKEGMNMSYMKGDSNNSNNLIFKYRNAVDKLRFKEFSNRNENESNLTNQDISNTKLKNSSINLSSNLESKIKSVLQDSQDKESKYIILIRT